MPPTLAGPLGPKPPVPTDGLPPPVPILPPVPGPLGPNPPVPVTGVVGVLYPAGLLGVTS
ncbi:hypothetical protein FEC77_07385 [Rickettsia parkeri]|uniref:hypothetical protein n=1 Tax=spotted fever group TaxID=114277 RepID=UPI000169C825|nr:MULTISPECIES: hypothetical protein [spotted fever group]QCS24822.1 hypothetical protein FEC77_07385 [Rickettsia parkeri]QWB87316.1 hypothetical protein JRD95_01388 [Rickettsia parkeri]